ncbi:MAG TPA: universal stress protein [Anseongella sp.]|nr:universal stress protein [Anseongella sp.]
MNLDFRKILIAVDDSPYSISAVKIGFGLARAIGAEVALVHVIDIALTAGDMMSGALAPEIMQTVKESGESLLSEMRDRYGEGIITRTYMPDDRPVHGILKTAEECQPDLIILGTHGRSGLDHLLMGSVAEHVVRKSSWPVLVVPKTDKNKTVS